MGPFCVIFDEEKARENALEHCCRLKSGKMDLTNHKTAYFALKSLPQVHKDNLKRMGYGEHLKSTPKTAQNQFNPNETHF